MAKALAHISSTGQISMALHCLGRDGCSRVELASQGQSGRPGGRVAAGEMGLWYYQPSTYKTPSRRPSASGKYSHGRRGRGCGCDWERDGMGWGRLRARQTLMQLGNADGNANANASRCRCKCKCKCRCECMRVWCHANGAFMQRQPGGAVPAGGRGRGGGLTLNEV